MPRLLFDRRRAWRLLGGLGAVALLGGMGGSSGRRVRGPAFDPADEVCVVAPLQAWSAADGLALTAPRPVPPDARCPVCGMYPARSPGWAAQAIFDDGATQFLDSPLDLLLYLRELPRHVRGRDLSQLRALYVTDAHAGAGHWLPARQAWYLRGSAALGPMRQGNLPAFATREAACAAARRHGGEALPWDALHGEGLDRLDARHVHRG